VVRGSQWPAPAPDCGTAGLFCGIQNICEEGTGCDGFTTELCLPSLQAAVSLMCFPGSCAASEPYCVAAQCMTLEQASCTCAKPDARERLSECAEGPDAALGMCLGVEEICASAPDNCCSGLTCVQVPGVIAQCFAPCTQDGDCPGSCCTPVGAGGQKICAPPGVCGPGPGAGAGGGSAVQCMQHGASCEANMPCCVGLTCFDSANPDFAGCRQFCSAASDCESNCCVPTSLGNGLCAPAADYCSEACTSGADCASNCCLPGLAADSAFCAPAHGCEPVACLPAGAACGSDQAAACCAGAICTGPATGASTCNPICTSSTECESGCCIGISGMEQKVCSAEGPAC
jgi:hypothetical protein